MKGLTVEHDMLFICLVQVARGQYIGLFFFFSLNKSYNRAMFVFRVSSFRSIIQMC